MRLKINLFKEYPYLSITQANQVFSTLINMSHVIEMHLRLDSYIKKSPCNTRRRKECCDDLCLAFDRVQYSQFRRQLKNLGEAALLLNSYLKSHGYKEMFELSSDTEEIDAIALAQKVFYMLKKVDDDEKKKVRPIIFDGFLNTLPQELQDVLRPQFVLAANYATFLGVLYDLDKNQNLANPAIYQARFDQIFEHISEVLQENGLVLDLGIDLLNEFPQLNMIQLNYVYYYLVSMEPEAKEMKKNLLEDRGDIWWFYRFSRNSKELYGYAAIINSYLKENGFTEVFAIGESHEETDIIALYKKVLLLVGSSQTEDVQLDHFERLIQPLSQELQNSLTPKLDMVVKYMKLLELMDFEKTEEELATYSSENFPNATVLNFYITRVEELYCQTNEILESNGFMRLFE